MVKLKQDERKTFINKSKKAILIKAHELNQVLSFDAKDKATILNDLAGITALVTKKVLSQDLPEELLLFVSRIANNLYNDFLRDKASVECEKNNKSYEQICIDEAKETVEGEKFDEYIEIPENSKGLSQNVINLFNECEGNFNPHSVFYARVSCLVLAYSVSNCEEADRLDFKRNFKAAVDGLSLDYRKVGKSEIADYIKAAGMALLGVLVGLMLSPVLLVSSSASRYVGSFFRRPETDESRKVQEEFGDKFVDSLFASPNPNRSASHFMEERMGEWGEEMGRTSDRFTMDGW
ncbi:MAG: hypothetical protein K0U37_09150 [Gammaproteobacteria bacterium]|nr:hypothetical protein [Gammaproteobacteria bacterium]